jgi:hypothetical protein
MRVTSFRFVLSELKGASFPMNALPEPQRETHREAASIDGPPSLNALVIRNDAELVSATIGVTVIGRLARAITVWITAWAISV